MTPCEMCENGEPCVHCLGAEVERLRSAVACAHRAMRAAMDDQTGTSRFGMIVTAESVLRSVLSDDRRNALERDVPLDNSRGYFDALVARFNDGDTNA